MSGITVYTTRICGYCHAAKSLLRSLDLDFAEVGLDGDPEGRQDLIRRTGQRTVPQIFVGEAHVGGFQELRAASRNGELDRLLEAAGIQVD